MSITVITAPAVEPLSLSAAKAYLRLEDAAEDEILTYLIRAARETAEAFTGLAFITRRVVETADGWRFDAAGCVSLSLGPVTAVHNVRVAERGGALAAIEVTHYTLAAGGRLLFNTAPPAPAQRAAAIEVEYSAGFGDTGADTPEPLLLAMRLLLAAAYENRTGFTPLPEAARALMAPYIRVRL